jgi:hypothetical protein
MEGETDQSGMAITVIECDAASYVGASIYDSGFTETASITRAGFTSGNLALVAWSHHEYGPRSGEFDSALEAGWSELAQLYFNGWDDNATGSCLWVYGQDNNSDTTAGTPGYGSTLFTGQETYGIFVELEEAGGGPATVDVEGARVRNDDGSETTATWKAAQDANATAQPGERIRIRFLLDATNDPASQQYTLRYRLKSDGAGESEEIA